MDEYRNFFCLVETSAVWHCNYGFLDTKGNWKLRFFILYCSFEIQEKQDNNKLNFFFFFYKRIYNLYHKKHKKILSKLFYYITQLHTIHFLAQEKRPQKNFFSFPEVKNTIPVRSDILFLLIDSTPFKPSKISSGLDHYKGPNTCKQKQSKGKAIPITGLDMPWGFQEVEASRFQDNRYMKVVRLSALRTDRLYPPRKCSRYSFLLEEESVPGP